MTPDPAGLMVDTHVHVVADDEERYPLNPSGVTGPWYREDPCSVERLLGLFDEADVGAAVLVQAMSAYRYDNRYTVDAAARYPQRCTAVVCVDLAGPDPAAEARRLLGLGARGLRWVAIHDGGVTEPRAVWEVAQHAAVPVVMTVLAEHLPALADALPAPARACRSRSTTAGSPTSATASPTTSARWPRSRTWS